MGSQSQKCNSMIKTLSSTGEALGSITGTRVSWRGVAGRGQRAGGEARWEDFSNLSSAHPVVVLESAPRTTPPSNCTAMIVV